MQGVNSNIRRRGRGFKRRRRRGRGFKRRRRGSARVGANTYLLREGPRNEISRGPLAPRQAAHDRFPADGSLQANLDDTEHLGDARGVQGHWAKQHKDMVGGGIRQQLQVIRRVLVVGGDIESHQLLEEGLTGLVVAEESVPVHTIPAHQTNPASS